ncbi:MAG: amino acid permease [Alphaproteobacteria bacterium]|jgi:APA family basic amino acid/polyamine antiporter|nr:amino acid permease [Candidatus Jidaibacter sp.]
MTQTSQKLGLIPLTSLVTGNLVGSGVFLLPVALAKFGSISLLGWILTTLGAIVLALIFAELSHKIPKNGGPYAFVSQAFGKELGFMIAWGYWTLSWISNSALIASAASYLTVITGDLDKSVMLFLEISVLFIVAAFNLFGLKTTGKGELIITTVKVLPLLIIPIVCLPFISFDNFPEFNISNSSTGVALNSVAFITLWAFVGVETATVPGSQVINPRRNIPIATIAGTIIAALVYILGTIVIFGVVPSDTLMASHAPYADAANFVFGGGWGSVTAIAAIITCVGSLNGWTIIVGRIAQAAADDGLFPKIFSKTNSMGTPAYAIIVSTVLTVPFIVLSINEGLMEQFNLIIDVTVTFVLFVYMACVLAFFKLIRGDKHLRVYRYIIGALAFGFLSWAFFATQPKMIFYSLLLALCGLPIRAFILFKRSRENQ